MKYYPYVLSEQRLSLLSPEERMQYNFEHSDYCDWGQKEFALQKANFNKSFNIIKEKYLNEMQGDESFQDISEVEMNDMAEQMASFESELIMNDVYEILKPIMSEKGMSQEEYDSIIEYTKSQLLPQNQSLNENTPGPDMTFWMKGLSLTLIPLFTGMAYLLMAGKTQGAINALKKYMNKLVEEIDDGTYKKQSFFKSMLNKITPKFLKNIKVKLFGGPKNIGANSEDQSHASFRELQEIFEGNIACKMMVLMKNIGLLPKNYNNAKESIETNKFNGGGYQTEFLNKIAEPLSSICNKI